MKKKLGVLISAGVLASALAVGSVYAAPLQPVTHTDWMQKKAIVVGDQGGDLALKRSVTLAETVVLITRINGKEVKKASVGEHWAAGVIDASLTAGAITNEEALKPNATPIASRVAEIAGKLGVELKLSGGQTVTRSEFIEALGSSITKHITIGHTNDVHGHIVENKDGKEFGYAKMATLINEWRKENTNFMLLDAGDTFQGTTYTNSFQGESILPILNHLAYETMAAGNHDFDYGMKQLLHLRDQMDYPIISSNIFNKDGSEFLEPVHFVEVSGKKFAFLGFVTEETPVVTHPNNVVGLTFKNPVEIAKKLVPELKKQADHIIVVSHVGVDVDREIAKNVSGIDLIIGGHSHTPLKTPEVVNGTYIVQDWEYGKSLGRADLFYYNGELVQFSGGLKEYDESVVADPEVKKLVEEVAKKVEGALNVVIAKAEVNLDGERTQVRSRETNLGNLAADIMRERTRSIAGYEADVAIIGGGDIRDNIQAGDITKKILQTAFPFPNTLAVVEVTGTELKASLENGVSQVEKGGGRFPQISGMSFTYDPSLPAGSRVLKVKVGGKELDSNKKYKVAANDYLIAGGDGYETLKQPGVFNTGIQIYDILEESLINMKTVNPTIEDRIIAVKK
ncbi:5'-nucleotidase C-terminal domain-containing protein [Paenibacillus sp. WQ 127069]|uniref:5'-nucleotidase C-terminal domain-containing protein n=1 Tax=Paenibacillus baimaensis TaxID=2982185 RepID=A0ABT2UF99_9BACL|nr:5'-nucleotidase C-terminal domain-containing protein [Paenibacillus sp. WQ 127069]MCU6793282.1 5'-nucleotidase C-terminal domain-containing protein [Paenibacillus sp. WQ 127069]